MLLLLQCFFSTGTRLLWLAAVDNAKAGPGTDRGHELKSRLLPKDLTTSLD